ncbi:hypothetical protein ZWY2020_021927 [Hordeum vulgare]|nr:hypothetical protein ZWY2020_021927 [Hordeum vulgare]
MAFRRRLQTATSKQHLSRTKTTLNDNEQSCSSRRRLSNGEADKRPEATSEPETWRGNLRPRILASERRGRPWQGAWWRPGTRARAAAGGGKEARASAARDVARLAKVGEEARGHCEAVKGRGEAAGRGDRVNSVGGGMAVTVRRPVRSASPPPARIPSLSLSPSPRSFPKSDRSRTTHLPNPEQQQQPPRPSPTRPLARPGSRPPPRRAVAAGHLPVGGGASSL